MLKAKHYTQINELMIISNDIELIILHYKVEKELLKRGLLNKEETTRHEEYKIKWNTIRE